MNARHRLAAALERVAGIPPLVAADAITAALRADPEFAAELLGGQAAWDSTRPQSRVIGPWVPTERNTP